MQTTPNISCSGLVSFTRAAYLIAYIFYGGATPCAGCKQKNIMLLSKPKVIGRVHG